MHGGYYTHMSWTRRKFEIFHSWKESLKIKIKLRHTEKDVSITIHGDWRKDWLLWMRQEERILADGLIIFWSEQGYEFSKDNPTTNTHKHLIVNGLPSFLGLGKVNGLRRAFNGIIVIKVLINHWSKEHENWSLIERI